MGLPGPAMVAERREPAGKSAVVVLAPPLDRSSPLQVRRLLAQTLEPGGWTCRVEEARSLDEVDSAVKRAAMEGRSLVVAAGGDATVARVARALVGSDTRLGIIPLGRQNSLAANLGIPADPKRAAELLAGVNGSVWLDSLDVNGRRCFLQAGTAVEPVNEESAAVPPVKDEGPSGLAARLKRWLGLESRRFTIVVDGRQFRVSAWQVIVVNTGEFAPGLLGSGPPVFPTDGLAEVIVLRVRSPLDLLKAGVRFVTTGQEPGVSVAFHQARESVLIVPDDPMPVQADGEPAGCTPLQVRVVPRSVEVVVPGPAPLETIPSIAPSEKVSAPQPAPTRRRLRRGWFRAELLTRLSPLAVVDTAIYTAVRRLPHPKLVDRVMLGIEEGMANGRGWVAGAIAANLVRGRSPWPDLMELAPALWLTTLTIEFPIKPVFARPRPFVALVLSPVIGTRPASFSFPSGHSASAFAGAWLLSRRHPKLSPLLYGFASLVSFSRVYLGVHYPSDVAIGAAVGAGLAALYSPIFGRIFRRIGASAARRANASADVQPE